MTSVRWTAMIVLAAGKQRVDGCAAVGTCYLKR